MDRSIQGYCDFCWWDVPVIVGSNADEGTVFVARAPDSQQGYQERAREKYQHLSDQFFAYYPVGSDEEAREAFLGKFRDEALTWPSGVILMLAGLRSRWITP